MASNTNGAVTEKLTPRQRVLNALNGLPVDRPPVAIPRAWRLSR